MMLRVLVWDEKNKTATVCEDDDCGFFERVMGAPLESDGTAKITRTTLKSLERNWIPAIKIEMETVYFKKLTYMLVRSSHNESVYWLSEE